MVGCGKEAGAAEAEGWRGAQGSSRQRTRRHASLHASTRPTRWQVQSSRRPPVGKRPQKTMGCASVYPPSASAAGCFLSVTVSPTRASATCLMEAARYPTSPAYRESTCGCVCGGAAGRGGAGRGGAGWGVGHNNNDKNNQ